MAVRALTTRQHERALEQARAKHDARYAVDHPKPQPETFSGDLTPLERAVQYLWAVWLVLGVAGALISLPHTLQTVIQTVELAPVLRVGYSLAVFVGVELALIGVALASELKRRDEEREQPKVWSVAGAVNGLAVRIGFKPPISTAHLPIRQEATGIGLIVGLFGAALTFNMADTLSDVSLLAPYAEQIHLAARLMAGALGPGLLLIAGHRFAHEVVKAASGRKSAERTYQDALDAWRDGLQDSWQDGSEQWITGALANAWRKRNPSAPDTLNPYHDAEGETAIPFAPVPSMNGNGNGHRAPASS